MSAIVRSAMFCLCAAVFVSACATKPSERNVGDAVSVPQRGEAGPATGATSGTGVSGTTSGASSTGPLESERGSVPPGKDRAGDHPSSGAIVDPTGATQTPLKP